MSQVPVVCTASTIFLIDKNSDEPQVLLFRRLDPPTNTWGQIAGMIEPEETAWQAALREVQEETGITLDEIWSADADIRFYVPEKNYFSILPVFVSHISRDTPIKLNHEHDAYQWFSFADAKALVSFPGQRRMLELIEEEFINRTPTPHLRINLSQSDEDDGSDLYARDSP